MLFYILAPVATGMLFLIVVGLNDLCHAIDRLGDVIKLHK